MTTPGSENITTMIKTLIKRNPFALKSIVAFILCLALVNTTFSQRIDILRFRNDLTYTPGSSVSVHVKLTDVFDLNNTFYLELSDPQGNFGNPIILSQINDFFIPSINGLIPTGTQNGTGYKLRVRASTTNAIASITNNFSITSSTAISSPILNATGFSSDRVQCITADPVPIFGYVNRNSNAKTSGGPFFSIQNFNTTSTYTINIFNSIGTNVGTFSNASNTFEFPRDLPVDYYIIEIQVTQNSISSVKSFNFLFNTGNTNLGNTSGEFVCIKEQVDFTIDIQNISKNYPGSKYIINYGDGSSEESFTHAQFLKNNLFKHEFNEPTCSSSSQKINNGEYFFKVDIKLFNKGITGPNGTPDCQNFSQNGNGTTKWVNAGKPPQADFTADSYSCLGNSLTLTNTSIPGAYGTKGACENTMLTSWYVKKPGEQSFTLKLLDEGKLNYTIPANEVNIVGCWEIKLEVKNLAGCEKISSKIKTIGIERAADPNFNILQNNAPVTKICAGSSIKLQDLTNIKNDNCQGAKYNWSIISSTGWQYLNNTSGSSPEPEIKFNDAGTYKINLSVTNSCGTKTIEKELIVSGEPSVSAPSPNQTVCTSAPASEIIDFNTPSFKPIYSTGALAPTSYTWTVNGSSTPGADWSFENSTNAGSAFPVIKLTAFKTYEIIVKINGNCGGQSSAKYTITLKEGAGITNTNLAQSICSGQTSTTVNITSNISGTTYSWTAVSNPTGAIPETPTGTQSSSSIPGIKLTNNTTAEAKLIYTIKAISSGCESAKDLVITVNPVPLAPSTSPIQTCVGATAPAFNITPTGTNTLKWYADATTTTSLGGTPAISTTAPLNISYYVSQISNSNPPCESNRSKVDVVVTGLPTPSITTGNSSSCTNPDGKLIISNLTPSTKYTVIYELNGNTLTKPDLTSNNSGVIEINGLSAGDYLNIRVELNGCSSSPIQKISITNPSAPENVKASPDVTLCSGQTLDLKAESTTPGTTFRWIGPNNFSASTAQTSITNITSAGNGNYQVTASVNGCDAAPAVVRVTVVATPAAPVVTSPLNLCKDASTPTLTASASSNNTLLWYTSLSGGTGSTQTPIISSTTIGKFSFYVSQITSTNPTCESPRATIDVNIFDIPSINGNASDPTNCLNPDGTITINGLQANSSYQVAYSLNGGNAIDQTLSTGSNTFIKLNNLAAGNYSNINVSLNGCKSNSLSFELKNPSSPKDVKINTNTPICSGNTLTLEASSSTQGAEFRWSGPAWAISPTGAVINILNASASMSGDYTVVASLAGCDAPGVSQKIIVTQTPDVPVVTSPVNYCHKVQGSPLSATALTDHTIRWYNTATGGTAQTSITPSTDNIGTFTFYASQITDAAPGCEGPRAPVVVNIFEIPSTTGSFTNPSNCINPDGTITINGLRQGTSYIISYVLNGGTAQQQTLSTNAGTSIQLTGLSAGNYTDVKVILNDCSSNPLSFSLKNPDAPSDVKISTNAPVCSGSTVTLEATSRTANTTFRWTGPAWPTTQAGAKQTILNAQANMTGDYTVIATIFGCDAPDVKQSIVIHQTPAPPDVTTPVNYCHKVTPVALSATPSGSNILKWYSSANGGAASLVAPVPVTDNLGTFEFFVSQQTTNTAPACEGERAKIEVFVNPIPVITASATPPTSCLVDNGTITIKGLKPGLIYEVQYDMNNVTIQKNSLQADANGNVLIINLPFGTYENLFVVSRGCPSNTVGPFKLASPDIPATPTVSSNSPLCPGAELRLFANTTSQGATFEWEGPNNFQSTLQNPIIPNISSNAVGTYNVTAVSQGCKSEKKPIDVSLYNAPVVDLGPDLSLPTGSQVTLNPVISFGPIRDWLWTPSSNLSCSTCPAPVVTVKKDQTYKVSVTNINGCKGSDEIFIKTFCENTQVYIPNAFTPDGDGKNDVFMVRGQGIQEVKSFRIYNRWGELVFERTNIKPNNPLLGWDGRVRGTPADIGVFAYTCEVICENGTPFFLKGNVTLLK